MSWHVATNKRSVLLNVVSKKTAGKLLLLKIEEGV